MAHERFVLVSFQSNWGALCVTCTTIQKQWHKSHTSLFVLPTPPVSAVTLGGNVLGRKKKKKAKANNPVTNWNLIWKLGQK